MESYMKLVSLEKLSDNEVFNTIFEIDLAV